MTPESTPERIASDIRTLHRELGVPIPRDWSDAEVLQFALEIIEGNQPKRKEP